MAAKDICDSCLRGDQEIPAISWCSDCEEKFCESCTRAHQFGKPTQSHRLIELKELSPVPSTSVESELCEHHQKPLDFFCQFHDTLCCRVCIPSNHKACDKIEPIYDICEDIKSSALMENLSEAITSLLETTGSIILNRKQNITNVKQQKEKITNQIADLKYNLIILVNNLEKSLLEQLNALEGKTTSDLEDEADTFEKVNQELQHIKQEFAFHVQYGSNRKLFKLVQTLKRNLQLKDSLLQDSSAQMRNMSLDYMENTQLARTVTSLATLNVVSTAVGIKHKPVTQCNLQSIFKLTSFTPAKSIDLSMHGCCIITSIELTKAGKLLFTDSYGKRLLLYDGDGTFLVKTTINGRPYQIAILPDKNQTAITLFGEKRILIVDTSTLSVLRQIHTDKPYGGILCISDKFKMIVGGTNELDIISIDGKILHSIPVSQTRNDYIRYIQKRPDGTVLYTDSEKIYCMDLLDETEIFRYTENTESRGTAIDRNQYIYVADRTQHNIQGLTPDGQFVDVVINENDGLKYPLSLKFIHDKSLLFVGMHECKSILVFHCK